MEKSGLRAVYLERRRAMPPEECAARSAAIVRRLVALPEVDEAETVATYLASKDNEVDTLAWVRQLLAEGRRVLVPVSRHDRSLLWSELNDLAEVAPTRFGILEPKPEFLRPAPVPPDAVAIVPGIAFTLHGARIGYGAGYYDRFLAAHPCTGIGLAFDAQLAEHIPLEPHDILMDIIVTESAVHRTG